MNNHETGDKRRHAGRDVEVVADPYDGEALIMPQFKLILGYRRAVVSIVAGVMGAFVVVILVAAIIVPVERIGEIGFRLLFSGASGGVYPNGLPFSSAEITATPVLREVFDENALSRFGSYEDFNNSVFILQSSDALNLLGYEYQTKLADGRLTPVDRASIEDEFQRKRESLADPRFTLNLRQDDRLITMPPLLVSKVLDDTLATWARQAQDRKGAFRYDIPVLSANIFPRNSLDDENWLTSVDMLRTKAVRIQSHMGMISTLPGASLVRVGDDQGSLDEARLRLAELLRFELQPSFLLMRRLEVSDEEAGRAAREYIGDRLLLVALERDEAQRRVIALQESLRAYMFQKGASLTGEQTAEAAVVGGGFGLGPNDSGLTPQLSESFLDRLVDMSTVNSDQGYRQELTDRIIEESIGLVALEREYEYYELAEGVSRRMEDRVSSVGDADREGAFLSAKARFENTRDEVTDLVAQVNAIYEELSALNLNPSTMLYSVTTPFMTRTERAVSIGAVLLYGTLVFMLSLFLVPLGCLVHSYYRNEKVGQTVMRPVRSASGGQSEGQREEEAAGRTASV